MFADLHLHSLYSDGTYSPEEVVSFARQNGLNVISLTDHDTVQGCLGATKACMRNGMEFIPGVELTAEIDDHEIHLLGYGMDTENARLQEALERFQGVRQDRVREMVARLNRLKVPLEEESVFTLANCLSPGRPHVARALVQKGLCKSVDEAFDRFLKRNRPAWVPKMKISAREAVELLHQAGGLAVLAHPGITSADHLIPALVEFGLDGIECFHTKHSTASSEYYIMLAEHHRVLVTGGSDCHGMSKGKPLIGTVKLPGVYLDSLRARVKELQSQCKPPDAD
jgi:predicted metal-dependent phosphoesterase TrpH